MNYTRLPIVTGWCVYLKIRVLFVIGVTIIMRHESGFAEINFLVFKTMAGIPSILNCFCLQTEALQLPVSWYGTYH